MILHNVANYTDNYNYDSGIYKNMESDLHFHDCYELIYSIEGYTKIKIDEKTDFLSNGEFILISPYITHSFSVDASSTAWIGVFSEDFISSFADKYKNAQFSKFTCEPQIEKMLEKYLVSGDASEHYMLTSCLYMVCNECEKNADKQVLNGNYKIKSSIISYVNENIFKDITMNDLASALGYEYHYLSSLFHDCFGMNFKNFINILRYYMACRLLSDKSKDITAISQECGFGSVRNFNRVFKKMSGLTPREYKSDIKGL